MISVHSAKKRRPNGNLSLKCNAQCGFGLTADCADSADDEKACAQLRSKTFSLISEAAQEGQKFAQGLVALIGIAVLIFFYSGTFFNWDGVRGLWQTFDPWFKTGHNGNGHEKPWPYWLKLIGRYEFPVAIGIVLSVVVGLLTVWLLVRRFFVSQRRAAVPMASFFDSISLRFLAIYGAGVLAAYSIVNYKTPWCIISIIWPFLFVFGAVLILTPKSFRPATNFVLGVVLAASLGSTIWLNFFRCTTETEPYVYVQTYNDIDKLTRPLLHSARRNPVYYHLVGHIIRTSAYPLPWILGDFSKVGYYEHENLPDKLDADFLVVEEDRVEDVEGKLQNSYYTMPMTIRPYQDPSKIYFDARVFKEYFRGRVPDFAGQAQQPQDHPPG